MALIHSTVSLLILLTFISSNNAAIECPKSSDCECINNEPCTLNCIGTDHCKGSDIELICKSSQPCNILCSGSAACQDATIIANGATHVTLTCTNGEDVCSGSTTLNCGTAECLVKCDSDSDGQCSNLDININDATGFECIGDNCPSNISPFTDPSPTPNPSISSVIPTTQTMFVPTQKNTPTPIMLGNVNSDQSERIRNSEDAYMLIIITVSVVLVICALIVTVFVIHKRKKSNNIKGMTVFPSMEGNGEMVMTTIQNANAKRTVTDSDSSTAPPPPPPTKSMINNTQKSGNKPKILMFNPNTGMNSAVSMDSDASIYMKQQKYYRQEMKQRNSAVTVATTATNSTDASLYATQQKYMQEETNVVIERNRKGSAATTATTSTDASLYATQQKYMQEEMNKIH